MAGGDCRIQYKTAWVSGMGEGLEQDQARHRYRLARRAAAR